MDEYDAGNPEHVKERREQAGRLERERDAYWKGMMDSYTGRFVLHDILRMTHCFKSSADFDNPNVTYFLEGERNIGQKMIEVLERVEPGAVHFLAREEKERKELKDGND